MDSKLYNTEDIVAKFSITKRTLNEWIKIGKIPKPIKIGRRNLWKPEVIDEYLKKLEEQ